jgi:hypothetical protein
MNPSDQKNQKNADASAYYKSLHSDESKPTPPPVVFHPAKTTSLKIAGACLVAGVVFAVIAVKTNIGGLLFEIASTLSFIASFAYLIVWSLKTIDKSVSTK